MATQPPSMGGSSSTTSDLRMADAQSSYGEERIYKDSSRFANTFSTANLPRHEEQAPEYHEDPPDYTVLDNNALTYHLRPPIILGGASVRYHFKVNRTQNGKPFQLCVRRLMPTESRRLSKIISTTGVAGLASNMETYDDDATMYQITKLTTLWVIGEAPMEIKGCRASTLPGTISVERESGLRSSKTNFIHVKRNHANDMLKPENSKKMEKHGYHPSDEWTRELLFTAKAVERGNKSHAVWTSRDRTEVAHEEGAFLTFAEKLDSATRDLLVVLWVARHWHKDKTGILGSLELQD